MKATTLDKDGLFVDDRHSFTTATGRRVNILDLTPEDIDIHDIAIALGNICRYGGHVARYLSVAEHCIQVHDLLSEFDSEMRKAGLLHDAHEAYIGDIIKPLKVHPSYSFFEDWAGHIDQCIGDAFDVDPALFTCPEVKNADLQAFYGENGARTGLLSPELATTAYLAVWNGHGW